MTKILNKTDVETIDRIIEEIEADEIVLENNQHNLDGVQEIRRQIKTEKPIANSE